LDDALHALAIADLRPRERHAGEDPGALFVAVRDVEESAEIVSCGGEVATGEGEAGKCFVRPSADVAGRITVRGGPQIVGAAEAETAREQVLGVGAEDRFPRGAPLGWQCGEEPAAHAPDSLETHGAAVPRLEHSSSRRGDGEELAEFLDGVLPAPGIAVSLERLNVPACVP